MQDNLKVAVFGAGKWGVNHVRSFHALGALAAVVDPSPAARAQAAELAPGVAVYADAAAVLADRAVAGVVLATPAKDHAADALAAIAAGKDVFVEKPMALSVADAERVAAAAEQAGRVLMIGHLLLYQPAVAWMRDAIAAGKIGRVLHVETRRLGLGTVRAVENVLWSFAPHDLAVIRVLLGEPQLAAVRATGQCAVQPQVQDVVHADYVFTTGAAAHVQTSWLWPYKLRTTTVIGDAGMIVYDEIAQTVRWFRAAVDPRTLQVRRDGEETVAVADAEPLKLECRHFLDRIGDRELPLSHGRHGVEVVRMLAHADAAMRS